MMFRFWYCYNYVHLHWNISDFCLCITFSTYNDMCTMLDDMVNENWLGITRNLARDIQQMLRNNGMTPGLCPQPPQTVSIIRNRIRLPTLPRALNFFAEVCIWYFHWIRAGIWWTAIFSSPEHNVLMMSYCDRPVSCVVNWISFKMHLHLNHWTSAVKLK
jgi:hypothetical protein